MIFSLADHKSPSPRASSRYANNPHAFFNSSIENNNQINHQNTFKKFSIGFFATIFPLVCSFIGGAISDTLPGWVSGAAIGVALESLYAWYVYGCKTPQCPRTSRVSSTVNLLEPPIPLLSERRSFVL